MKNVQVQITVDAEDFEAAKALAVSVKENAGKQMPPEDYNVNVLVVSAESFVP